MTASKEDELVFLPLGGCGEIGMNLNAYGFGPERDRKWIIVDLGVTFGDATTPGVDVITPDPSWLAEQADDVLAIVLTHAHEDHIGAVGRLWDRFRAPIYATPFTALLVKDKLREANVLDKAELHEVPLGGKVALGPFDIEYVTLTHSIPEPNGLAIRTPLGLILHTGDWKIDPDPLIGEDFDHETIDRLGDAGVLAMVCDSTNVFVEGEAGSEGDVREGLKKVIAEQSGRVAVACFASNVARLQSVMKAAEACDRRVCLVGRSMHRITGAAKAVGLLTDVQDFVSEEEAGYLPPENVLYLCTGSQGEPRAALARIARGGHPHVSLGEGDAVIFSSRVIPGNELGIFELMNALADRGVKLVTEPRNEIHVSGHPCRDELKRMYQWARPKIAIPVHGERRHILEHQRFAKSMQTPFAMAPRNGDLIRLAPGDPAVIDEVPSGRLYDEGHALTPDGGFGMRERKKLAYSGVITVAVAVTDKGAVRDGPVVSARGLSGVDGGAPDEELVEIENAVDTLLDKLSRNDLSDDEALEREIYRRARRAAEAQFGRRPIVDVVILRV